GIEQLHIASNLIGIVGQLHLVEHALRVAIDEGGRQFPHEPLRAHTFLNDAPRLTLSSSKKSSRVTTPPDESGSFSAEARQWCPHAKLFFLAVRSRSITSPQHGPM